MVVANAPRVSILLPSLNARKFLEPRIESLRNQTFSDWEAIVLDSQSTDGTWELFQSVEKNDARFNLHQIPRGGLYAALNRGFELATGNFIHIATCDDSMAPEFLMEMLRAFAICPEAGMAASDVLLIDRNGAALTENGLSGIMSKRSARTLLSLDRVRTAFPDNAPHQINCRPVPHDCLLHFDGRSVYLSLNQLVVRTAPARAAAPFDTTIGSVADFKWLLRLTSSTGTVHIPKKLAMWRCHGGQLSLQPDPSRADSRKAAAESALRDIRERNLISLTSNDRAALLLVFEAEKARSVVGRLGVWFKSLFRLARMLVERPIATMKALARVRFRFGTRRHTLVPLIFEANELAPKIVEELRR
jgi:glycosyltransferase involved in cell wall biosynthesis